MSLPPYNPDRNPVEWAQLRLVDNANQIVKRYPDRHAKAAALHDPLCDAYASAYESPQMVGVFTTEGRQEPPSLNAVRHAVETIVGTAHTVKHMGVTGLSTPICKKLTPSLGTPNDFSDANTGKESPLSRITRARHALVEMGIRNKQEHQPELAWLEQTAAQMAQDMQTIASGQAQGPRINPSDRTWSGGR